jgi:hypothetical protein
MASKRRIRIAIAIVATAVAGAFGASVAFAGTNSSTYEPALDPAHFVSVIDNPYFPMPVGRTLIYKGVRDGQTQTDRVTVTSRTKVIEGITATVERDVARHDGTLLEQTTDWYAQDDQGNVWYLGEDTTAYNPNGTIDKSGSWLSGVHDGEPGIIMVAHPAVPDSYRQEYLKGQAEDMAWIVDRGGSVTVPFGTLDQTIRSIEVSRLEPDVVDQKIYAPGYGIVKELALAGDQEVAKLVKVIG